MNASSPETTGTPAPVAPAIDLTGVPATPNRIVVVVTNNPVISGRLGFLAPQVRGEAVESRRIAVSPEGGWGKCSIGGIGSELDRMELVHADKRANGVALTFERPSAADDLAKNLLLATAGRRFRQGFNRGQNAGLDAAVETARAEGAKYVHHTVYVTASGIRTDVYVLNGTAKRLEQRLEYAVAEAPKEEAASLDENASEEQKEAARVAALNTLFAGKSLAVARPFTFDQV